MSAENQSLSPIDFDIQTVQHWIPDPTNPTPDTIDTLKAIYDPNSHNPHVGKQVLRRVAKLEGLSTLQPGVDYSQLDEVMQDVYQNTLDLQSRVVDAALLENAEWDKHYAETHESKTGLLNKDGLYEKLDQWTDLSRQTLVITVDCRKFKTMNDTYGHKFGDVMIDEVAQILQRSFRGIAFTGDRGKREPDLVARVDNVDAAKARVGGDEFVVGVLLDSNQTVDEYLAIFNQRIESQMNQLFDTYEDEAVKELGFGLTLGAAVRKPGEPIEDVINRSDLAQLRNKDRQNADNPEVGQVSKILLAED